MADHKMREPKRVTEARFQELVEKNSLLRDEVEKLKLIIEVQGLQKELEESRQDGTRQEATRHRAPLVQLGDLATISEVRRWRRQRQTTGVRVKDDKSSYNFSNIRVGRFDSDTRKVPLFMQAFFGMDKLRLGQYCDLDRRGPN